MRTLVGFNHQFDRLNAMARRDAMRALRGVRASDEPLRERTGFFARLFRRRRSRAANDGSNTEG